MMYYPLLRRLLFLFNPELAHHITLTLLKLRYPSSVVVRTRKKLVQQPVNILGLHFPNPVGLAAGLDKNGDYIDNLFGLGFGFIEVGAVTPKPQSGNPKPRLIRVAQAQALINRMGFNNKGVDYLVQRLRQRRVPGIVGVNIGKNRDTPYEQAINDYDICYQKLYPYADFVTVNISSPNTPGLRKLQQPEYLSELLLHLKQTQRRLYQQHQRHVPLLVKISPDSDFADIQQIAQQLLEHQIEGVIATNTSLHRDGIEHLPQASEKGGLSGQPLLTRSSKIVHHLQSILAGQIPIIGVGGVNSAESAREMIKSGASLLQLYTGLIYQGPQLIKDILSALDE